MGKKGKQEELPGLERRDVPEIEQAADRYRRIRDERCELSKQEAETKAALIQVMKNKGRQFYSYNGLNVQLSNQENVKVKARDEDDEEPVGTFTQPARRKSWQRQSDEQEEVEICYSDKDPMEKCVCGDYRAEHTKSGGCMLAACDCTEFRPAEADDFTAPRCDECGRIDGAHAPACSQSGTLTYDDYFRYSQAHGKGHHASHARKMDLKRDPKVDAKVRDWKRRQAGNGPAAEWPEEQSNEGGQQ